MGGPGDRARNTGVIVLVVPKETSPDGQGHVFIETGLGAEGFITDATAGAMRDEAIPLFRQRDYGGGIELIHRCDTQQQLDGANHADRAVKFMDQRSRPVVCADR